MAIVVEEEVPEENPLHSIRVCSVELQIAHGEVQRRDLWPVLPQFAHTKVLRALLDPNSPVPGAVDCAVVAWSLMLEPRGLAKLLLMPIDADLQGRGNGADLKVNSLAAGGAECLSVELGGVGAFGIERLIVSDFFGV